MSRCICRNLLQQVNGNHVILSIKATKFSRFTVACQGKSVLHFDVTYIICIWMFQHGIRWYGMLFHSIWYMFCISFDVTLCCIISEMIIESHGFLARFCYYILTIRKRQQYDTVAIMCLQCSVVQKCGWFIYFCFVLLELPKNLLVFDWYIYLYFVGCLTFVIALHVLVYERDTTKHDNTAPCIHLDIYP